jgi:hypothetical protein
MQTSIRHPEVRAEGRASKDARFEALPPSPFEGRVAAASG